MHGAAGAEPPPSAEIQVLCSSTGQTKSGRGHRRWLRPCPPPLCSVCCWGQRDRAGGRARRSAGMTPTSCLCGWLASSKANSSLRGVLCYPNPHNGFLFFFSSSEVTNISEAGKRCPGHRCVGTARSHVPSCTTSAAGLASRDERNWSFCKTHLRAERQFPCMGLQDDLKQLQAITEMNLSFYLSFHFHFYLCLTFSLSCIIVCVSLLCLHRYFWIEVILYSNFIELPSLQFPHHVKIMMEL